MCSHTHTHTHIHTHTHTHKHKLTHAHTDVCTHKGTHTDLEHTHTHTHHPLWKTQFTVFGSGRCSPGGRGWLQWAAVPAGRRQRAVCGARPALPPPPPPPAPPLPLGSAAASPGQAA